MYNIIVFNWLHDITQQFNESSVQAFLDVNVMQCLYRTAREKLRSWKNVSVSLRKTAAWIVACNWLYDTIGVSTGDRLSADRCWRISRKRMFFHKYAKLYALRIWFRVIRYLLIGINSGDRAIECRLRCVYPSF